MSVTAGNDADTAADTVALTHSAASTDSDYSGITIAGVAVTVEDNDTAQVTGVMVAAGQCAAGGGAGRRWPTPRATRCSGSRELRASIPLNRQATVISLGTTTTRTITGLTNGTEYTVQVSATRTGANDGAPSAEVKGTPVAPTTRTVTLALSDASIGEDGGVSTVTATVSPAAATAFTVTVSAAPVSPAVAADFMLSGNKALSFAANATTSTGVVTITGVDNDVDAADKTVTVSGTVSATGVTAPADLTLTLEDDDVAGVTVSETALTVVEEDGTGESYTVVLDTEPTASVTVTVSGHADTDVSLDKTTLTFTTTDWETAQTVTVTAGDDGDMVNDAVALTHSAASVDTDYSGITIAGVAVTVEDNDTANTAPTFPMTTADRSIAENTAAGQNIGGAFTATDSDGDALTYTLEGTDADSFDIATTSTGSAQIRTKTGVAYNQEATPSYTVVVKADDGNSGTATVTVTITVTDVNEPPGAPAAPSVSGTSGSTTSLDVSWTAPDNTGPDIDSYDLQYRPGNSGNFTNGPQNVTGTSTTIPNLMANTSYQVQVRATNAEGDGEWSPAGTGTTNATVVRRPSAMRMYFTESYGSRKAADESGDSNSMVGDCSGEKYFRAIWNGPTYRVADEWEVQATPSDGASVSQIEVRNTDGRPDHPEFIGKARFQTRENDRSSIAFKVRGRYQNVWSEWSPVSKLWCNHQ